MSNCFIKNDIPDVELLVRLACFDNQVNNKNNPKIGMFKRPDNKGISLIRLSYVGEGFIFEKGVELAEKLTQSSGKSKEFRGYFVVSAEAIRASDEFGAVDVKDSREPPPDHYCGHADMIYLFDIPDMEEDEPCGDNDFNIRIKKISQNILSKILFFEYVN